MSSEKETKSSYIIPNLDRALRVMELLADNPKGLTMSEISDALKIPKNSAFRITATMDHRGFLERDPLSKAYILTNKMTNISHSTLAEKSLVENAWPSMLQLRDETLETILFGTLVDTKGVVLEQAPAHHGFKFTVDIGTQFGLHTAAPGKAMLAHMSEREQDRFIQAMSFEKYTKNTITNADDFRTELAKAKIQGYGVDCDEEREGMRCVAAPVFNSKRQPIAAIWLTGPSSRIPIKNFPKLGQACIDAATEISKKLGA
ncbi:IclR family transcriptional regulator [Lentisphaera profundi]|uniref:IclR family transcriptional regulator n=1 Tax=Lentisphaera profundi TaxID=1658616 RepID=A0ABY7VNT6_9BACT|nr:IclR family transcriptional regulator [Lentisphaera profundi]WDE95332.1 IclR family transcriptional regulator [Lentisphaera profundi]